MAVRIQFRRGTSTEWSSVNPVLADGELGFENDTKVIKFGDGSTAWNSLPVAAAGDITAVIAGTGLTGGATSGQATLAIDSSYVITAASIDAAGDLIVGAGPDTYARLPIGPSGSVLVADPSQSVGVRWAAASSSGGAVVPTGTILPYAGVATSGVELPGGFFLCDGYAISRSQYSALFNVLSVGGSPLYGPGNGSSTFNLPDLRGKVPVGLKPGDTGTVNFGTLATTVGTKSVTLDSTKVPKHTHDITFAANSGLHPHVNATSSNDSPTHTHTITVPSTGSGHMHRLDTLSLSSPGSGFYNAPSVANNTTATTKDGDGGHAHPGASATGGAHNHPINIPDGGTHTHPATITDSLSATVPLDLAQPSLVINYIIKT